MEFNNINKTLNNDIYTYEGNKSNSNAKHNLNVDVKTEKRSNKEYTISEESLDKLVNEVNHKFKLFNKELSYKIHEETNRISVEIKDSETGEVIKEIPSEESLDLSAKIKEMAGLLIDEIS